MKIAAADSGFGAKAKAFDAKADVFFLVSCS